MKQCKKCGIICQDSQNFCGECGSNIENKFIYICNHCGRIYDAGSVECPKCHAKPDIQLPASSADKAKELQEAATQKADELKEKAAVAATAAAGVAASLLKTASEKTSEAGQKAAEFAKTASEKASKITAETKDKVNDTVQNASSTLNQNRPAYNNKILISLAVLLIVIGGLGGYFLFGRPSDNKNNIVQSDLSSASKAGQDPKPIEKESKSTEQPPKFVVNQDTAREAFISFHGAITNKQIAEAYNILSPQYQKFMRSYDNFARGYTTTLRSDVTDLNTIEEKPNSAILTYKLKAVDREGAGEKVQYFIGKASLIKNNGKWFIDSTEAKKASQNSKAPVHLANVIAKGEVNLRANPTTNANSVGVVREGDWVDILETGTCKDSSAAIVISDEIYFGSGSNRTQLSKGMPIQIVSDNGSQIICRVNVNGRPENVSFAPNHLVKLYGTTWYKIAGNGATGWVYSNYISKQ